MFVFKKLEIYGFSEKAMMWIRSYLSGRSQRVIVAEELSSSVEIDKGTPQGSRLSPLLFLTLMADLNLHISKGHLSNFADDTQLTIIEKNNYLSCRPSRTHR